MSASSRDAAHSGTSAAERSSVRSAPRLEKNRELSASGLTGPGRAPTLDTDCPTWPEEKTASSQGGFASPSQHPCGTEKAGRRRAHFPRRQGGHTFDHQHSSESVTDHRCLRPDPAPLARVRAARGISTRPSIRGRAGIARRPRASLCSPGPCGASGLAWYRAQRQPPQGRRLHAKLRRCRPGHCGTSG
jgi:hypothetical protein